jgi:hypothetical protein
LDEKEGVGDRFLTEFDGGVSAQNSFALSISGGGAIP